MKIFDKIFESIANAWIIPSDLIPDHVDAVVSTSQGMFEGKLVGQNQEHMEEVLKISRARPEAVVGYSAFAGSEDPSAEEEIKRNILWGKRSVFVGPVSNTASEAIAYQVGLWEFLGREPRTIVVVSSQFHGRALRFVYQREFPNSQIILVFTPWQGEIDPLSLHVLSRNRWLWLLGNILRQIGFMMPFGYWAFKKLDVQQPNVH